MQPDMKAFWSSNLKPEEVEEILRRIDENLALGPIIAGNSNRMEAANLGESPTLPDLPNLLGKLQEVRQAEAPFFVIKGQWLHRLMRRVLNLPMRVFGQKQAFFSREVLDLLHLMTSQLQNLHQHAQYQLAEVGGQASQLQNLQYEVRKQRKSIDLAGKLLVMLSPDLRERLAADEPFNKYLPDPRCINAERYAKRLAEMGEHLKVNLGCGENPWPDYINVDLREVFDVDIAADARKLPFEQGTLAELASAHLVEHFREYQFRTHILPYWKNLLKPDGVLRIICPNWAAMLERLHDGRMSLADFKKVTFGAQNYEGDDHFMMYTPETLTVLLNAAGFSRVEVESKERMNGLCPEMELVARL
jgi:predicted SAM-dependent methyltransferase